MMNIEQFMMAQELVCQYRSVETKRQSAKEMRKWGYIRLGELRLDGDLQQAICESLVEYYTAEIDRLKITLHHLGVDV